MKITDPFIKYLIIGLCSYCLAACSDNDDRDTPSGTSPIVMESEGGEVVVDLARDDYSIDGVMYVDGNYRHNIFGEIYSAEGEMIRENAVLCMPGTGQLESVWSDHGFRIIRDDLSLLKIKLDENITYSEFKFSIVLKAGTETREIEVLQKESSGYTFDKIEYSLKPDDVDSLYFTEGIPNIYHSDILFDLTYNPFDAVDMSRRFYFVSDNPHTFEWMGEHTTPVTVPDRVISNQIIYKDDKFPYSSEKTAEKCTSCQDYRTTVSAIKGSVMITTRIQFRKTTVSYLITFINNRTKLPKQVGGKWIQIMPTMVFYSETTPL